MYSIKTSAILFIYFSVFVFETVFAAENGYIIGEEIPCEEPTASIVSESCVRSIDYKIPDISKIPNAKSLFPVTNGIIRNTTFTLEKLGNQQCSKSGKKYLCQAAHPLRCEEEYIRIDTKELKSNCRQARESCSAINATSQYQYFNCSNIDYDYGTMPKIRRKLACLDFPALKGDPYTCDANYKVFVYNATGLSTIAQGIVVSHKALENSTADKECKEKVAEVICKAPLPACSSDHKKVIALLSKEKCREMIRCLDKTNDNLLINEVHGMCNSLPSEKTAKKYSLDNVSDGKAASNAMAFGTILFFVFLVAQLVF